MSGFNNGGTLTAAKIAAAGGLLAVNNLSDVTAATARSNLAIGIEVIQRQVLAAPAASISFTGIPATYEQLELVVIGRSDAAALASTNLQLRFNNDSGANYDSMQLVASGVAAPTLTEGFGQTVMQAGFIPASTATASRDGGTRTIIPGYARTDFHKIVLVEDGYSMASSTTNLPIRSIAGVWRSTAAINRVDIIVGDPNLMAGTVATLYGLR